MNQFECKSCIYRRWHHDSESSLQTVSWHGFPRTDVVSRQQQSTAQQQSEWRRWWPVRISAPQRSLLWSGSLRISTFYHQSCRTQSKNSQARMQKLQLQPTTSEFEYEWIKYLLWLFQRMNIIKKQKIMKKGSSYLGEVQWLFLSFIWFQLWFSISITRKKNKRITN